MRKNGIRGIDIAIVIAAMAGYFVCYQLSNWTWNQLFWDFDVYQRAVTDVVLGYDPYRRDVAHPFFYHPAVLYTFLGLDRLVGLENVSVVLSGAALVLFLWGCNRFRLQGAPLQHMPVRDQVVALLAAFSCGGAGVLALITGNITLWLHLALIGSVLIYLDGRRTGPHFLMLALFSISLLVKPYFLIYALPLLLVERLSPRSTALRSVVMLALSILLSAMVYSLFWVFDRSHTLQFLHALKTQADTGTDLGISFFGLALHILPAGTAFGIHVAISAALAVAVLCSRRLLAGVPLAGLNEGALFLLSYGAITLCNPRMKEYDLVPAVICLYLYFSLHGRFGKSLVVLSLLIAQVLLWCVRYTGASNVRDIEVLLGGLQLMAIVLPLLLFFAGNIWRMRSNHRAAVGV